MSSQQQQCRSCGQDRKDLLNRSEIGDILCDPCLQVQLNAHPITYSDQFKSSLSKLLRNQGTMVGYGCLKVVATWSDLLRANQCEEIKQAQEWLVHVFRAFLIWCQEKKSFDRHEVDEITGLVTLQETLQKMAGSYMYIPDFKSFICAFGELLIITNPQFKEKEKA